MAKASKQKDTEVLEIEAEEIPVEQKIEKTINQELQKANVTETIIANLKEKYLPLSIKGQEDKETYMAVVEARKDCKKWRILAEKVCKKGRESAVIEQKLWLAKEKDVAGRIGEVETYLETQETAWETERDRLKAERKALQDANYTNRTLQLTKMGAEFTGVSFVLGDISYDAGLIRETDTDIYETTILPKYREIFDKNEATRIENERIKKEQEAELQRQRDELAQQLELAAEQQRILKEQQDELVEQRKQAERREEELARQERARKAQAEEQLWRGRLSQFEGVGWNGQDAHALYDETIILATYEQLITLDNDAFNKIRDTHNNKVAELNEARRIEDERKAREVEEERKAEAARLQKDAVEKALEQEREKQRKADERKEQDRIAEEQRKAEQLAQASDKEKWAIFLNALGEITVPECRSGQYRKKAAISKEKIEEIINL